MKKRKFLIVSSIVLLSALVIAACSKSFLDKPPLGTVSPQIVATEKGVQGLLIGAYSLLDGAGASGDDQTSGASNWVYGGVASDDAYKGSDPTDFSNIATLEDWSVTPSSGLTPGKWNLGYAGIQRSNEVLKVMRQATDIQDTTPIVAQALFLRAWYHFELRKVFGRIIYSDENVNPQNTNVSNSAEVWPRIEADLNYAIANLPESWGTEVGRVNKWAAEATLAKVYLFEAGAGNASPDPSKYAAAYTLLQDVIANGKTSGGVKYALMPNFF